MASDEMSVRCLGSLEFAAKVLSLVESDQLDEDMLKAMARSPHFGVLDKFVLRVKRCRSEQDAFEERAESAKRQRGEDQPASDSEAEPEDSDAGVANIAEVPAVTSATGQALLSPSSLWLASPEPEDDAPPSPEQIMLQEQAEVSSYEVKAVEQRQQQTKRDEDARVALAHAEAERVRQETDAAREQQEQQHRLRQQREAQDRAKREEDERLRQQQREVQEIARREEEQRQQREAQERERREEEERQHRQREAQESAKREEEERLRQQHEAQERVKREEEERLRQQREAQERAKREEEKRQQQREAQERAKREEEERLRQQQQREREVQERARREEEERLQREAHERAEEQREQQQREREAQERARRDEEERQQRKAQEIARREEEERRQQQQREREAQEQTTREAHERATREAQEQTTLEEEERQQRATQEQKKREEEELQRQQREEDQKQRQAAEEERKRLEAEEQAKRDKLRQESERGEDEEALIARKLVEARAKRAAATPASARHIKKYIDSIESEREHMEKGVTIPTEQFLQMLSDVKNDGLIIHNQTFAVMKDRLPKFLKEWRLDQLLVRWEASLTPALGSSSSSGLVSQDEYEMKERAWKVLESTFGSYDTLLWPNSTGTRKDGSSLYTVHLTLGPNSDGLQVNCVGTVGAAILRVPGYLNPRFWIKEERFHMLERMARLVSDNIKFTYPKRKFNALLTAKSNFDVSPKFRPKTAGYNLGRYWYGFVPITRQFQAGDKMTPEELDKTLNSVRAISADQHALTVTMFPHASSIWFAVLLVDGSTAQRENVEGVAHMLTATVTDYAELGYVYWQP